MQEKFLQSYKSLPACVYQFQTKFRNEKRAKSWLLRGREFKMKDAYSFHDSQEDLTKYFEEMRAAYHRIFHRAGIGDSTVDAYADGGEFTDIPSVEFQTFTDIGEDVLFFDESSDTWYNQEVTPSQAPSYAYSDESKEFTREMREGITGVQALIKEFGIDIEQSTKTLLYERDGKMMAVVLRSDYDVNMIKVRQIAGNGWEPATAQMIKKITWAEPGYAGLYNLPEEIELYVDDAVAPMTNFETWGNETGLHVTNCNWDRDISRPEEFYDLKEAKEGDINPKTGKSYEYRKTSEVGNIFDLWQKCSKAFDIKTTSENGDVFAPWMGCYGVGITRLMGIVAEVFADEKWLVWPESIAPYTHYIVVHGDHLDRAKQIARGLESEGKAVLIDDRDCGFGQKAADADLLGIPYRVVVSDRTQDQEGGYELTERIA